MSRIRIDVNKLKVYLYEQFDGAFSRSWDDLPEHVQKHWTEAAEEMSEELISQGIVEIIEF